MAVHELKCWPEFFEEIRDGRKTCDLRKDDRHYRVGDNLLLQEWSPEIEKFTGRQLIVQVTHILDEPKWGLQPGWVALSIKAVEG
ncbi:DUF3850 domain-containing protein [bacterium]|nr:DUF3850 domain-containing protein [bacterium]